MAVQERLQVEFDHAQRRVARHAQYVLAQASYESKGERRSLGFDVSLSSNFWQDPVSYTGMLKPNVEQDAWKTTFTGIYARMRKTDFSFLTSALWREETNGGTGDYWLAADAITADESAVSTATYAKNQPFWIGYFGYNSDVQRYKVFECGWHDSADIEGGLALRFWSDGEVEVWKETLLATYKISGYNSNDTTGQQFNGLLLIPGRKRDLLVVSKKGDGFVHTFDDLDESDEEPAVTAEGAKFWINVPYQSATRSFKCQVAKIQFPSSGYAVSSLLSFANPPTADQDPTGPNFDVYGDLYGGTLTPALKKDDGTTAFTPDGLVTGCRIRVDLAGTGSRSPMLYGCRAAYNGKEGETSDEPVDVLDWVTDGHLEVGEGANSVSYGIALARLHTLEAAVPGIKDQSNRPVRLKFTDGAFVMDARSDPLEWDEAAGEEEDDLESGSMLLRDGWKALELNAYRSVTPLDGLTLDEALRRLTATVVAPTDYDIDASALTYEIASNSSPTRGEWTALVEAGDNSAQWVDRLFDNYAPDWVYGLRPGAGDKAVFYAKPPEALGTTSDLEVYDNWQQAFDSYVSDGYSEREARKLTQGRCFRTFRQRSIEPEATEVHVTGWNPRTLKPVHVYKVDEDAEDPSVPRGSRVDNWLGDKRAYGWVDTLISSESLARACVEKLFNRLAVRRRVAEWTSGLLFNPDGTLVWRGDNVKLVRRGVPMVYRVTSVRCTFLKERDTSVDDALGQWFWREATYCGELVNEERDAWRGIGNAVTLDEIVRASKLRTMLDPVRCSRGSEFLLNRVPETRVLVA